MIHVHPLDEKHDTTNKGNTCKCEPKVIIWANGEILVVHKSFDGREGIEWAKEILNKAL